MIFNLLDASVDSPLLPLASFCFRPGAPSSSSSSSSSLPAWPLSLTLLPAKRPSDLCVHPRTYVLINTTSKDSLLSQDSRIKLAYSTLEDTSCRSVRTSVSQRGTYRIRNSCKAIGIIEGGPRDLTGPSVETFSFSSYSKKGIKKNKVDAFGAYKNEDCRGTRRMCN